MTEKRYQVFVSSTYTDLADERSAVIQAILGLDHLPAGMEMFPSADEDQWELIKQVIDQSDYYVVVVAGRYGSVTADGISFTEKEYDYAVESGIPVLGFVHKEPQNIPVKDTDADPAAQKKLAEFRSKVQGKPVNFFTSAEGLSGQVVTSLVQAIKKNPRVGWVRGDKAMSLETERELIDLKKALAEAERQRDEAERTMVEDTSSLSQGDDQAPVSVRVTWTELYTAYYGDFPTVATWDEIFSAIGPALIDEASESELKERCGHALETLTEAPWRPKLPDDAGRIQFTMSDDSWDTVVLQLRALGLVDTGIKKRGVQDTNRYLRITEKGLRHLAIIRAIRSPK